MRSVIIFILACIYSSFLSAQPGDKEHHFINRKAYTDNFIHFALDSVHLAKFITEAQQVGLEMNDSILCKLMIPLGLTNQAKHIEKSQKYPKGRFDFTTAKNYRIKFVFYVNSKPMGSSTYTYEANGSDELPFEAIYKLTRMKGDSGYNLAYAYFNSIKDLGIGVHRIDLVAQLLPASNEYTSGETIAAGGFVLMVRQEAMQLWRQKHGLVINYHPLPILATPPHPAIDTNGGNLNPLLKYMADSTMKALFGEDCLTRLFEMSCFKNPCDYGGVYGVNQAPCDANAISHCGDALVVYRHRNLDIPLTIEISSYITNIGRYVYVKDNYYGKHQVPQERLRLLSMAEMNERIQEQFPNDSLGVRNFNQQILTYSIGRLYKNPVKHGKFKFDSGSVIEEETAEGEAWNGGFIYTAYSKDVNAKPYIYYFDATNGNYLMKVGFQKVTEEQK